MERILTYHITKAETGITAARYLRQRGFSAANLTDLKKDPNAVLINDRPEYLIYPLQAGDVLTITIREQISSEKIPPVELPLTIVYEDEDLLVVNKPAGMPTHPSMNNYTNSLANAVAWYYARQGRPFVFRCVSRLDRDTSGLTLIAKHMVSASILSAAVRSKEVRREYLGITRSRNTSGLTPEESGLPATGLIDAPLGRKPGSIIERTIDHTEGESALTHYRFLGEKNGYRLISLVLETGRTHQIRIHLKHLGFPLIGDVIYNPDLEAIQRQALHSWRLSFRHPITGEAMSFLAPLPEDMRRVINPR